MPVTMIPTRDKDEAPATPLQVFEGLEAFISAFLVCDDHQLTLLTLWIAYTWSFTRFHIMPYLDIRSPESQCGKSLCLRLLELLIEQPALLTAPDAETVFRRLTENRSFPQIEKNIENAKHPRFFMTFLIDDCHQSLRSSERQRLVALLNCGSDISSRYSHGHGDYFVACPKAFAGNTPLPESLASRCIPITLRRKKFSDQIKPFFADDLVTPCNTFKHWLHEWAKEIGPRLEQTRSKPIQLPPALSPRQQQCAEPLLRIANMIGGSWPARARAALMAAFGSTLYSDQIQVLRDIRELFLSNNQPETILTNDVLAHLRNLEDRPWTTWGNNSRNLSNLLRPFGIFSRDMKVDGSSLKGYRTKDFQDAWERYAGPVAARRDSEISVATT